MRSLFAWAAAFVLLCASVDGAATQDQGQATVAMQNSDAVARTLFSHLIERQTGAPVPPDRFWAYEVDFDLDGFSEIYGFVDEPDCAGVMCGLFLFVLQGDGYGEVLGDLAGARLTDPAKVFLGNFKRNGFLELQLGDQTGAWDGQTYVDASTFAATTLDGAAFLVACESRWSDGEGDNADAVAAKCQCSFNRAQTDGVTQQQLDDVAKEMAGNPNTDYSFVDAPNWNETFEKVNDAITGCDVAAGKTQWQPASIQHGEQQQTERLDFDGFIDACQGEDWIVSHRKIGSADRALGLCGCLARELPTYGVNQGQMDLLTRYYAGEVSDADLDRQDSALLGSHDTASEACLQQFPAK